MFAAYLKLKRKKNSKVFKEEKAQFSSPMHKKITIIIIFMGYMIISPYPVNDALNKQASHIRKIIVYVLTSVLRGGREEKVSFSIIYKMSGLD